MSAKPSAAEVPVLLLKTKSTPHDNYEEYFAIQQRPYQPEFVPVLEHRFREQALKDIWNSISQGKFLYPGSYGGIIFTSQRAVEAFTQIIERFRRDMPGGREYIEGLLPKHLVFYVVGPATGKGLRALNLPPPILGADTGNGDALADFILDDFNSRYLEDAKDGVSKPKLMFLVGEQRRDIIPRKLQVMTTGLERIVVEEITVYETGEMASFESDFSRTWIRHTERGVQVLWVVVFSPTGCKAMLRSLNLLNNATNRALSREDIAKSFNGTTRTLVATIGPTTREYLLREYGFEPDVCSTKPSPESLCEDIEAYMRQNG